MGVMWPRIGRNALAIASGGDCTEASDRFQAVWGFGLCGAPIACRHRTAERRTYATRLLQSISVGYRELVRFSSENLAHLPPMYLKFLRVKFRRAARAPRAAQACPVAPQHAHLPPHPPLYTQ